MHSAASRQSNDGLFLSIYKVLENQDLVPRLDLIFKVTFAPYPVAYWAHISVYRLLFQGVRTSLHGIQS